MQDNDVAQFINQESFLNYCFNRNDEDVRYWEKWLTENSEHVLQVQAMKQMLILMAEESRERIKQEHFSELQDRIAQSASPQNIREVRLWPRIAVAASILFCLSFGGYFLLHKKQASQQITQNQPRDIAPGGNKAILTLSNGEKIILDGKNGQIASQAGRAVMVSANGNIIYSGQANSGKVVYNTLAVPIGNRRDLTLPDGSQVNLDAGSSITYPVVFDKERKVSITGQAYIIVKHDATHPFYTTVKGITIKDIGTEFNINAYDDEPNVKTTLIQGSVQVNETILKPGEQAQIKNKNIIVKTADLDAVTAWKNNDFYFENQSLKSSMRQIARWYNVDVVYQNVDEKLQLFVDVSRATNLSVVLKAIENTGKVKCSLQGQTITLSQTN